MSFDLKIEDGDLRIGSNGDLAVVEHSEKMIQDVLKILMTPLNGNIFFPWYGSPISKSLIGAAFEGKFIAAIATNQIRNALETLKNLQEDQLTGGQFVSSREQIAAIEDISVQRNEVDPRIFRVGITVLSKAFTTTRTNFQLTL